MPQTLDHSALISALLPAVLAAGRLELGYFRAGVAVERKADRSPVTAADREAEAIIVAAIAELSPGTVVAAEEEISTRGLPAAADEFFLVDPLDGTRDFVAGTEDFSVNVALVRDRRPVFGMILLPARGELFATLGPNHAAMASVDLLAKSDGVPAPAWRTISVRSPPKGGLVVLMSPWRPPEPVERMLSGAPIAGRTMAGSSYKFCLLARGDADVYPQAGATHEWDTAAGQALVEAAGGRVLTTDGRPLAYGKHGAGYLNPPFVCWGHTA